MACVTSSENLCASPCCITRRGLVLKCVVSEALVEIFVVADALDALGMTLLMCLVGIEIAVLSGCCCS